MIHTLAIDTTSDFLSLAVARNGEPVAHHYAHSGTRMAGEMFGVLDRLLVEAGLTLGELGLIVVARGPGSFTGTRLGLAMARTFAQVQGCPLAGVDTLRLLAAQSEPRPGERIHAALNCIRQEVYYAVYEWEETRLREVAPVSVMEMAELPARCGDEPVVLRCFRPPKSGQEVVTPSWRSATLVHEHPDGRLLLREGITMLAEAQDNLAGLPPADPIYLKSEAFRKWKP